MSADSAAREQLERIFRAALAAVDPARAVEAVVRRRGRRLELAGEALPPGARLAVLAAGKAARPMAAAFAAAAGDLVDRGLLVAPGQGPAPPPGFRALRGAHPVPDERSERAGRAALAFAAGVGPDETLVVLLSGGSSSLLACPAEGVALAELAQLTRRLLGAGAPIEELNCVRRQLSAVAGGRLAAATRAGRVIVLVVSDVLGDRLDVIGSGPFAADPSRVEDAREVLSRRGLWDSAPAGVRRQLGAGARGERPGSAPDPRVCHRIVASNRDALAGAAAAARREGLAPLLVSDRLCGEAREAGRRLARLARSLRPPRPLCLLAGGETTVRVTGGGRGGRSQELALAAALELEGSDGVVLLAAGTDGCDGPTDAAGAFADATGVARGAALGLDAADRLGDNDAHGFFDATGDLLRTGPTGTNVMDLVLIRRAACERA